MSNLATTIKLISSKIGHSEWIQRKCNLPKAPKNIVIMFIWDWKNDNESDSPSFLKEDESREEPLIATQQLDWFVGRKAVFRFFYCMCTCGGKQP